MAYDPLRYLGLSKNVPELKIISSAPTVTTGGKLGDFVLDSSSGLLYYLASKEGGVKTWKNVQGGYDYQESVISQIAYASATATEGNRYLSTATSGLWTDNYIYQYTSEEWIGTAPSEGMIVFDEDTAGYLLYSSSAWGSFTTGITTIAAATDVTITTAAEANVLIFDTVWKNQAISGDVAITKAGATTVTGLTFGSDAQGDIAVRGVASYDRLSAKTDKAILVGDGTDVKSVVVTGDVSLLNTGATTVTDLTIASEAQGTLLQYTGAGWEVLAVGAAGQSLLSAGASANNYWGTPALSSATTIANGCILNDAGANDATLAFTTQTVGTCALTIPDFASVADTFVFTTLAQTLASKTLTAPDINGGTADSLTGFSIRSSGAAFDLEQDTAEVLTGGKKISWSVGDTDRTITLGGNIALGGTLTTLGSVTGTGAFTLGYTLTNNTTVTLPITGTLSTLAGTEELTNKTITSGIVKTSLVFQQATANYTLTVVDPAAARALSIIDPLGDDAFVFADAAQTLTTKTIDCASNTVSNINGAELEDAAATTALGMAIPFIIKKDISNALTTVLYNAAFPQKARLIKAWVEETDNNTGNVTIDDGADAICAAVAYSGTDTDVTDFPNIDDSKSTLAANATLRCLNSVNTDDAMVYMMFIPVL